MCVTPLLWLVSPPLRRTAACVSRRAPPRLTNIVTLRRGHHVALCHRYAQRRITTIVHGEAFTALEADIGAYFERCRAPSLDDVAAVPCWPRVLPFVS